MNPHTLALGQPWVMAILVVATPLVVFAAHRRLSLSGPRQRVGVVGIHLTVVALVLLALAQPTLRPIGHGRAVVFAIDVSDSIAPDQLAWARDWVDRAIAALPPGSHSSVIEFGVRAQLSGTIGSPPGGSTNLTTAIDMAASMLPRDASLAPEIVLLTDGWQTASSLPTDAVPSGVAVSYVALPEPAYGEQPTAVIHALDVPPVVRAGERVDVQLDIQATQASDVRLRLWVDSAVIADGPVHFDPGESRMTLPALIARPGFVQVRASLGDASTGSSNSLSSVVVAKPAGRVLVLQDDAAPADALAALLADQGLELQRRSASSVPPSAEGLSDFDGIVLVNTPATSLALDQQRTLQSFVQDLGRGLVIVGGPRAYSPGGYEDTILNDLSPVSAEPPIAPKQGSLALFLVIDRSGSMDVTYNGATKIAMADEAAAEAVGLLQPNDTVGVIAFDSAFTWVVPPTMLHGPADAQPIQDRLLSIQAGGGTSILPPLEAAFQAAQQSNAPLKHILLMTDGESNDKGYEDLLARMTQANVTLSTLAIGSDADTRLLTMLAHMGGGRYYFTERSTQIPRIASKETNILTRDAIIEGKVAAVVTDPSPILRSLAGDLPPLSGYVATTRKDRAVTALETESGHPLLAHWQDGLGRVVAWTSEAQQGWASEWAHWPGAAQFWSQAVRWALPAPVQADFQPSAHLDPDGRDVHLAVQSLSKDGRYADLQDTRATVVSPDGTARELPLPQRAPGLYALDTRVGAPGQYRVLFKQSGREETAAFVAPDSVELHSVGVNAALLDELANLSGGRPLTAPTDLRPGDGPGPVVELWPWCLLAALVLFPVDVFLRRRV